MSSMSNSLIIPAPHEMTSLAERRLRESPYFFLRNVRCGFDAGTLTLEGWVPFVPLKQFAETIVRRIDGVYDVCNRVEVVDPLRPTHGASGA